MLADRMKTLAADGDFRLSRRRFLLATMATSAGLAVGFRPFAAGGQDGASGLPDPFEAYVEIAKDGAVTVLSSQFDMGQGSYHGIATLVVEELGCDWSQVSVTGAAGNTKLYGNLAWGGAMQGTGGSSSMVSSWERYREAGAAARQLLVAAAAEAWGVPAAGIEVEAGRLTHQASGNSAGFGEFARTAATLTPPQDVKLKPRSQWSEIGDPELRRYDSRPKTDGTHDFTTDLRLPGMLTAVMIHPPKFGATVGSFEAAKAKAMAGVVDVVSIPRGVAIVAEDMWTALKARDSVNVEWNESAAETRGSAEIMGEYRDLAGKPPAAMARNDGDVESAMGSADKVLEATFEFPYLAHAAMEPLNAVALRTPEGVLEVWGGHQMPDLYQGLAAQIAELPPERVRMKVMKTGGGFGRRAVSDGDVVTEAVHIAKALNWRAPVKVQWTRENDMRGGRYRPAYVHRLRAGLNSDGMPVAWENRIVGQSIMAGTVMEGSIKDGVDPTSVEGAANLPYAIPNLSVGLTTTDVGVPVLWWRSVGSTHTAYATEVFIDELAEAAGADPVDFRLRLLEGHPRHAGVLKLAAEKAGWGKSLPNGHFQGVAVHESFSSYVAEVAEISMVDGRPKVHRVVAAVDCGTAINPNVIKAQVEGAIGFGLGAILQEELTLTDGEVDQTNYDSYRPLRIDSMPEVQVHIVDSEESPTGIGEPGLPPIGPAVANAVYRATGKRVRALPFEKGLRA